MSSFNDFVDAFAGSNSGRREAERTIAAAISASDSKKEAELATLRAKVAGLERENVGLKSDCVLSAHAYDMLKAERDALTTPPEVDDWKKLVAIAYSDDGDGVTRISRITAEYNRMKATRDGLAVALEEIGKIACYDAQWANLVEVQRTAICAIVDRKLESEGEKLGVIVKAHDAEKDREIARLKDLIERMEGQVFDNADEAKADCESEYPNPYHQACP